MKKKCPYCDCHGLENSNFGIVVRAGKYRRTSDSQTVQRYFCKTCGKHFSAATNQSCYWQKKRQLNFTLAQHRSNSVSLNASARMLNINRKTVVRKFLLHGQECEEVLRDMTRNGAIASTMEFDDLECFEHTKLKPLSITLAVEHRTRRILGFEVSRMPAKGRLAELSRKKYGQRIDERAKGRDNLFRNISCHIANDALIKSDQNPHYPNDIKKHFPNATHQTTKGRRGCVVGQGELKKIGFDPLFSLNHTCAMLRANINRLLRKTWCTTKKPERLKLHIAIYAVAHNKHLEKMARKKLAA